MCAIYRQYRPGQCPIDPILRNTPGASQILKEGENFEVYGL